MSDSFQVKLSSREQTLISDLTMSDPDMIAKFEKTRAEDGSVILTLSYAELENLVENVAADSNHAKSRKLERELDALYDKLEKVLERRVF